MSSHNVGIIGLGLVGTALAERFLTAGFSVAGYDISREARQRHSERGGHAVDSACELLLSTDRLIFSLPDSDVVASVWSEISSHVQPGTVIVDTTTGDPDRTAALGAVSAKAGVNYLDATIVGSSEQVRGGEAVMLVGGEPSVAEECADLFDCFARQWFHLGTWGAGARMKLVVNLVLGLNRAVLAEGLSFARACGFDLAETLKVLQSGAAYSRAMDAKGAKMIAGDFQPQAKLSQHLKDVRLILASAERVNAKTPLSAIHRQLLELAESAGYGDADNSAVIRAFD